MNLEPSESQQPPTADNSNPPPLLVETSGGQDINISEKTERTISCDEEATTLCDEDHNPLASILSDVLRSINKPDDVLEVNVSDSINLSNGFSSLDSDKDKGQEPAESTEKTLQGSGDSVIQAQVNDKYKPNETLDYKAAADTNTVGDNRGAMIQLEAAVEQPKSDFSDNLDDDVQEPEVVAVPALKNDAKLVSSLSVSYSQSLCTFYTQVNSNPLSLLINIIIRYKFTFLVIVKYNTVLHSCELSHTSVNKNALESLLRGYSQIIITVLCQTFL